MTTPSRFTPTAPRSPLERWVLVALYVVVLLPIVGVGVTLATGGSIYGITLANVGEVPSWIVVWLLAGALLAMLVALWAVTLLVEWLSGPRNRV